MSIHRHILDGCAPAPLAHYLKALGILRLVAGQTDPAARGAWEGERFVLLTGLTEDELVEFFLRRYEPTPLVSPWNRGSGFFSSGLEDVGRMATSTATRLAPMRRAIEDAREVVEAIRKADGLVRAIKGKANKLPSAKRLAYRNSTEYKEALAAAERQFKEEKALLIPSCRARWRGPHREWMDAALVLDADGAPAYPALLGTGGADGRLDFTVNQMQVLATLFSTEDGEPTADAEHLLRASLFGGVSDRLTAGQAIGQFLPGSAGGANSTTGPAGESLVNPWDFVLMLEGCVLFSAHASRRFSAAGTSMVSAPFAVRSRSAGYATASEMEEGPRGEQWMPLWPQPATLGEVRRMFSEGRSQLGSRAVRQPLDLARAIARLGVARGITSFQRFGFIQRNGQSNLAVPLGRWIVAPQPHQDLLDDLDGWIDRLQRAAADDASARLRNVEHQLSEAVFAVTAHGAEPARWQTVLLALADIEACMAAGSGFKIGPCPTLRPGWVVAADDGQPELRLALALAGQAASHRTDGSPIDSVRSHWLPLDRAGRRFATVDNGKRLSSDVRVVCQGRDAVADCISLVSRRTLESTQHGGRLLPLQATPGAAAHPADVASLLAGQVDLQRVLRLARPLMALDWRAWQCGNFRPRPPTDGQWPDETWCALRLTHLPAPLEAGRSIPVDTAILRRLDGGDVPGAVELARRRLQGSGVPCAVWAAAGASAQARLLAASLAFPVSHAFVRRCTDRLNPQSKEGSKHAH